MDDVQKLNGSSITSTNTTDESLTNATPTATTCGSNGRSLLAKCYRTNYCSNGESLVKAKNLNEVSLGNAKAHTKSCDSNGELLVVAKSNAKAHTKSCDSNGELLVVAKSYSKLCNSDEISEGATGISKTSTGISEANFNPSHAPVDSVERATATIHSSESCQVAHETLVSKEIKEEVPSLNTHYSYLSVSLVNTSPKVSSAEGESLTRQTPPRSRYPEELSARSFPQRRISQSRPSSPPPATYFPPPRRPSLSLPPSPQSSRIHRISLPSNALLSLSLPSSIRSVTSSTHSSPSSSRPRTPTPPPINRRSPRRRSARTPSPRPPLPPHATNEPAAVPQQPPPPPPNRSRQQECQPYKMRMRSR